jgi:cytochrome oxidase Cu insertion factor (SCO1/SenC/PrrC family)
METAMWAVRRTAPLLIAAIVVSLAAPAVGAPSEAAHHVKPKHGPYSGSADYPTTDPVTFKVNHKSTKVVDFESAAYVKQGCTAPNSSFQTPITPKKISKSGHFKQSESDYTNPTTGKPYHVTVTVKGHFTSSKKVKGTFALVSTKYKHCNLTADWSAKHGS